MEELKEVLEIKERLDNIKNNLINVNLDLLYNRLEDIKAKLIKKIDELNCL